MSYIGDYLLFTSNTESPPDYHRWACLSSLSVLAGRRFWFDLGPIRFYPNLYVILVGHPGVKKSSALDRAKDIVRGVNCCPVAAAQATKEFIAKVMSNEKFPGKRHFKWNGKLEEYNQYAIFATEFTQFIEANSIHARLSLQFTRESLRLRHERSVRIWLLGHTSPCLFVSPEMMKGYGR
jgi:hypothetical protein